MHIKYDGYDYCYNAKQKCKSHKQIRGRSVFRCMLTLWSQVCLVTPLLWATMDSDFPLLPLLPPLRLRSNLEFNHSFKISIWTVPSTRTSKCWQVHLSRSFIQRIKRTVNVDNWINEENCNDYFAFKKSWCRERLTDFKDFDQWGDKNMDFKIRRNRFSHLQNLVAVNVERSKSDFSIFCNFSQDPDR